MEAVGFAISHAEVDINDSDIADEIEAIENEMDSQFNRKMDEEGEESDNGYYNYS
jgi:hypothetical protein